jgi:putative inorganic carbon (hco3(-)) transporter
MRDLLDPQIMLAIVVLAGTALAMFRWPDIGLVLGVILLYLNLPAVASKIHGVPGILAGSFGIVVVPALIQRFLSSKPRFVVDLPMILMYLFLASILLSSFMAQEFELALGWVLKYLFEGLLLYTLMVNLVRNAESMRRVVWALLISGSMLASMTLYQELTGNYHQQFGGLAQRMLERETASIETQDQLGGHTRTKIRVAHRAQGPIDDPNRYSQMLIVLVPLAWALMRRAPSALGRWVAAGSGLMLLGAIFLTYSRGAFLTLMVMTAMITLLRGVKLVHIAACILAFIIGVSIFVPGYTERITTLWGVQGLVSEETNYGPDAVQRGRATEMLAAWNVFRDYPVLGVGPGQFAKVYSLEYMSTGYNMRRIVETRRAHSLILEMLAETGAIGVGIFLAIIFVLIRRLYGLWTMRKVTDPEAADFGLAFILSITGYMGTALFLQLSYQRYYWFLIAMASAVVHIANSGGFRRVTVPQAVPARTAGRISETLASPR